MQTQQSRIVDGAGCLFLAEPTRVRGLTEQSGTACRCFHRGTDTKSRFTLIELLACRPKLSERRQVRSRFTLIELLVVIAIIAILASMLLPALSKARARAQNITCVSNQKECGIAFLMYGNDNNGIMPLQRKNTATTWFFWSEILNQEMFLPAKNVLQCPSISPRRYLIRNLTYGVAVLASDYPTVESVHVIESYGTGLTFTYALPEKSKKPAQLAMMAESVNNWAAAPTTGADPGWNSIYDWRLSTAPAATGTTMAAHFRHDNRANFLFADGHAASQTINECARDATTRLDSTRTTVYGRDMFFAVKSVVIN